MIEVRIRQQLGAFTLAAEFAAPASGVTALFGRSGAGKTSLINAIGGITRPDDGVVRVGPRTFFDRAAGIDVPLERRGVGYVFQDSRLFPHLTVESNLRYGARRSRGRAPVIDFDSAVALLDIGPLLARRPHALSGGERQRVALGRALLSRPTLLLMDEPLASLDAARKEEILPYIVRLRDELGLPIVYVSHAIEEIVRLADHLLLLSDGSIEAAGPLQEVMARPELAPVLGRFEAGVTLDCTVLRHDRADGLATLAFADGELLVPSVDVPEGGTLRVRVRARDVSIALARPRDISISNQLRGEIVDIVEREASFADVAVSLGRTRIRALVTRASVARLRLRPGLPVWTLVKAVAFDGRALGMRRGGRDDPYAAPAAPGASAPRVSPAARGRLAR